MKTGDVEYDTTTADIFVVSNDCGIYNIIFKKPFLNVGRLTFDKQ